MSVMMFYKLRNRSFAHFFEFEAKVKNLVVQIIRTNDIQVYYGTHNHMDYDHGFGYYTASSIEELLISIPSELVLPLELINDIKSSSIARYEISQSLGRCLISYELGNTQSFLDELEKISQTVFNRRFMKEMEQAICIS